MAFSDGGDDIPVHGVMRWNELSISRAAHAAGIAPAVYHQEPGALVLESLSAAKARGAKILGVIHGCGERADDFHRTRSKPDGSPIIATIAAGIADAGMEPSDIDYINAHGTSTPLGDQAEVSAVKTLFGDHAYSLAMSSTKSCTGHTLGAAGGVESIAVVKAIQDGVMPPTINLENPDDGFDLNFVANTAQERTIKLALNNSFGFGGHNVSLAFAAFT